MNSKTIALTLLTILLIWGIQGTSSGFFDDIIDVVEDVIEDVEDVVEDVIDETEDVIEDIEDTAEDVIDETENVIDNTIDDVVDAFDIVENVIDDVITGVVEIVSDAAELTVEIDSTIKWKTGQLTNIVTSSFDADLIGVNLLDQIHLWDPITKKVVATFNYDATINDIAVSLDGLTLASGSIDKTVQLWNTETQKLITTLKGHTDEILTVGFSPDGLMLASGGRDKTVRLWNIETQKLITTLKGHTERVKSVAFSPDGSILASSSVDKTIRLWDTETQELITTLKGHTRSVPRILFSPDGSMLASAGADGTARIWNPLTEQLLATLDNEFHLRAIAFSPDGLMLAAGTEDGIARLWDLTTKEVLVTLKHENPLKSVAFTAGGNMLIICNNDNTMQQWEISTTRTESVQLKADVNGDGTVNIFDVILVASQFGLTGENVADVNGDGFVNIQDLVLVAGAFNDGAAAPDIQRQSIEMLTAADVQKWLSEASQLELTDAASQRGILLLQQLLATLTPQKETALLPNYPNPFNPETWIPYQLATPADVRISIYTADGKLVRMLNLGHQPAGIYSHRSHAAYWDGRNALGEPVASGIYFYTFLAGKFTATRKMLIRK